MYSEKNFYQNQATVWVNLENDLIHRAFYFIPLTCLYCFERRSAVGDRKTPLLNFFLYFVCGRKVMEWSRWLGKMKGQSRHVYKNPEWLGFAWVQTVKNEPLKRGGKCGNSSKVGTRRLLLFTLPAGGWTLNDKMLLPKWNSSLLFLLKNIWTFFGSWISRSIFVETKRWNLFQTISKHKMKK